MSVVEGRQTAAYDGDAGGVPDRDAGELAAGAGGSGCRSRRRWDRCCVSCRRIRTAGCSGSGAAAGCGRHPDPVLGVGREAAGVRERRAPDASAGLARLLQARRTRAARSASGTRRTSSRPGNTETIYGNMPLLGLGKVAGRRPGEHPGRTAAERLHQALARRRLRRADCGAGYSAGVQFIRDLGTLLRRGDFRRCSRCG